MRVPTGGDEAVRRVRVAPHLQILHVALAPLRFA